MDARAAKRHARRELAAHARHKAADPGITGDPDDRARLVDAYVKLADWLAPGETSGLPANLIPLVTPSGTPPEGAPREWSAADATEPRAAAAG